MYSSPSSQMQVELVASVSEHGKFRMQKRQTSFPVSILRWLQLKNYQYEVTFSLYMLTPTERVIFNSILFLLVSLFVTATFFYLPNHVTTIYKRVWYYVEGSTVSTTLVDAVKTTKAALSYQTTVAPILQTTDNILKEL